MMIKHVIISAVMRYHLIRNSTKICNNVFNKQIIKTHSTIYKISISIKTADKTCDRIS